MSPNDPPTETETSNDPSHTPTAQPVSQVPTPVQSVNRAGRPQSVQMPSPPIYRSNSGLPRAGSPSLNNTRKPLTPTGSEGHSPIVSPLGGGPMSPSSNLGAQSFIFPIRSVFQGMSQSDSNQSIYNQEHTSGMQRVVSRSSAAPIRAGLGRSPSKQGVKQQDYSGEGEDDENDAGMQTIAQMLKQGSTSGTAQRQVERQANPGVVTFTGKQGAERNVSSGGRATSPTINEHEQTGPPPQGYFSAPIRDAEKKGDSLFDLRRNSMTASTSSRQSERPSLRHEGSGDTEKGNPIKPTNDSAEASGSGLPKKGRAPVGQPQEKVTEVNFRDQPGPSSGPRTFATARNPPRRSNAQGDSSTENSPTTATHPANDPADGQFDIKAPKPRSVGPGGLQGLGNSTDGSVSSRNRSSGTALEVDEDGEKSLIHDFSGIVRLDSLPENDVISGSGKNSRDRASGSKASGPTGARLAQQQRQAKLSNTNDSVRNFINDQAKTVNLPDPNAPTPSPTPHEDASPLEALGRMGRGEGLGIRRADGDDSLGESSEGSSMSVRDSSEMATASGEDEGGTGDEAQAEEEEDVPITTLRFEHVSTEDGHHVVIGREGMLQRCEDEPITTPGAVQGFGVLIVLEEDYESGRLSVRQASENSTELLGLSPRYLFRLECFSNILVADQEDLLRDNIEYLTGPEDLDDTNKADGPQVFLLSGFGEPGSDDSDEAETSSDTEGRRREWTCWVAAHRPKQPTWDKVDENGQPIDPPDLIVLEFELERDLYNPLMQTFERSDLASTDTPDSASQSTISAKSRLGRAGSTDSGGPSNESLTTVGSTPRPGLQSTSASSGTVQGIDDPIKEDASRPSTSGSKPSLRIPRGSEPMGLEGVDVEMPLERILESTTNHAKPLRALERMRGSGPGSSSNSRSGTSNTTSRGGRGRRPPRRQAGSATGTMDVFAVLGQINEQLGAAPDLETFLKITVGVVQDLCRFHRVLIYQFDEAYNGQVVAELVEWGKTTDLYKGLMFPAADIPAQARQLYMTNKVRLLYDRSQTTARMVLRTREDLDHPLDMTHCYLRAMSPIHIKYLANMHVRSSMSVSIMAFGQLWGLIACHAYGHHGMRVSFPVRQMMRILSDSISRNIERLSYAQRLHTRKLISTIPTQAHPTGYIVSNADDLLQIFDADAGLLVIGEGCKLLGNNEQGTAMLAIAEYLRIVKFDTPRSSSHLAKDFPDLTLPRARDTIAGLLYVPLTVKAGQDFIVFLRKGQAKEVQWAGKPYKDETTGTKASLEPRKSFKTWSETVTGRSRAWTDDQLESAGVLALIYGKFIQVWREKQSAMASNQLTAILLSNTSHAVRTPLSQIINTLELALSGNIDSDTRSMLENSHAASRALLFHVHDLLDLTRIETGNETAFNDPFDIRQSINDAVRLYQTESARRKLDFRLNMADNLPRYVIGDSRKIKTVISNLVANSVKFTEKGFIEVYCGVQEREGSNTSEVSQTGFVPLEIIISDTGCGIPNDKLEAMFVTLEGADEQKSESTGLGLGLAVVARIVEQLQGQLRGESEVGVGTRFFFTLSMLVHEGRTDSGGGSVGSDGRSVGRPRTGSSGAGSVVSLHSGASGPSSEIDHFVQDFGSSHMFGPVAADDHRIRDAEARMNRPGTFPVTDSSYPVRPSRMADTESDASSGGSNGPTRNAAALPSTSPVQRPRVGGRTLSYAARSPQHSRSNTAILPTPSTPMHPPPSPSPAKNPPSRQNSAPPTPRSKRGPKGEQKLRVLVVEDDAINSQILQKRLRMDKHSVLAVSNGQEAVDALNGDWDVDAVLMDIQMPIMDGKTAASEIRKLEAVLDHQDHISPLRVDGRIPIFAISASLYESDRSSLAENFDGWLLKPLDFPRVRALFAGLEDPAKRSAEVYVQGQWERGGYLRDPPRRSSLEGKP